MLWILFALAGGYFLISVRAPEGQTKFSSVMQGNLKTFIKSMYLPRIKLGIDLQGGTYFVLGVGVEKAIENRLIKEHKQLEELFRSENLKVKPKKSIVRETEVEYQFEEDADARVCFHFIRKHAQMLSPTTKDNLLIVALNAADEQRLRNGVVEQAENVLQNRLNGFGVAGLIVQRHGERQIVVQLPGVDDP